MISDSVSSQSRWVYYRPFGQAELTDVQAVAVSDKGVLFAGSKGKLTSWDITDLTQISVIAYQSLIGYVSKITIVSKKLFVLNTTSVDPSANNQLIKLYSKSLDQELVIARGVLDFDITGENIYCVKGDSTIYVYDINTGIQREALNTTGVMLKTIAFMNRMVCAASVDSDKSDSTSFLFHEYNAAEEKSKHESAISAVNLSKTQSGDLISYGTTPNNLPSIQIRCPDNDRHMEVTLEDSFGLQPKAFLQTEDFVFLALGVDRIIPVTPGIKVFRNNATLDEVAFLKRAYKGGFRYPLSLAAANNNQIFVGTQDGIDIWTKPLQELSKPEECKFSLKQKINLDAPIDAFAFIGDHVFTATGSTLTMWMFKNEELNFSEATVLLNNPVVNMIAFNGYLYCVSQTMSNEGVLTIVNPDTFSVEKKTMFDSPIHLCFDEKNLFIYCKKQILKVDPKTLELVLKFTTVEEIYSMTIVGDYLFAFGEKNLATFNPLNGARKKILKSDLAAVGMMMPLGKSSVLVTGCLSPRLNEGFRIYSVDPSGKIVLQRSVNRENSIFGSAAIFDKDIIFTSLAGIEVYSDDMGFNRNYSLSCKQGEKRIQKFDEDTFFLSSRSNKFLSKARYKFSVWKKNLCKNS